MDWFVKGARFMLACVAQVDGPAPLLRNDQPAKYPQSRPILIAVQRLRKEPPAGATRGRERQGASGPGPDSQAVTESHMLAISAKAAAQRDHS